MNQNKLKGLKKSFSILILVLFFTGSFFSITSCKLRASQNSLTSQFDLIDSFISQNHYQDAIKELKKAEKKAYDTWSYIGIYKRYNQIGENERSEKILKKSLKKLNEKLELVALYTSFLLKNDRIEEACVTGKSLQGTKYGSLYSEAMLREILIKMNKETPEAFYKDSKYYQIYYDAYKGTRNPIWLRNCALFNLATGQYESAASINPGTSADADDSYFWSQVMFDAGKYYESIQYLKLAKKYLNDYKLGTSVKATDIQITALLSDSYMILSDMESSQKAREEITSNIKEITNVSIKDEKLLPLIALNSAIWFDNQGDYDRTGDLLFYIVNRWEEYTPGIIRYADFAYKSSLEPEESNEKKALRKAGLSTIEMEKYDNRIKYPVSDALYRIEKAIEKTHNPNLYIEQLDIKYKMNKNLSVKEKTSDLWNLLEQTYTQEEKYKSLLVQYSINYLLGTKQVEEAYSLFEKYVKETYGFNNKENFWEQLCDKIRAIELPFVELAGYFSALQLNQTVSIRLLEYSVFESNGIMDDGVVSPYVTTASCMNLADIYYSTGRREEALDLYGKAAGRESNNRTRSEIFFRLAKIYVDLNDAKNALRSADYATTIYPENAKAALLKDRLLYK